MAKKKTAKTAARKTAPQKKAARKTAPRKTAARKTASRKTASRPDRTTARRSVRTTATRPVRKSAKRPARKKAPAKPGVVATAATLVRGTAAAATAAIARWLPWSEDENDPVVLLEADHRRFEDLLEQGTETTERAVKRRAEIFGALASALAVHEAIEEQILYPALKPHAETHDKVLEGYQEHHVADVIVNELRLLAKGDEKWGAKFKVLKESLEHHIQEEEGEMFRMARAVLSSDELSALGKRMKALKSELEAAAR